jgi:hypothetical protein
MWQFWQRGCCNTERIGSNNLSAAFAGGGVCEDAAPVERQAAARARAGRSIPEMVWRGASRLNQDRYIAFFAMSLLLRESGVPPY